MKRIFILTITCLIAYLSYGQREADYDYLNVRQQINFRGDSLGKYIQDITSGDATTASDGITKNVDNFELGGSLTKDITILGNGYILYNGTGASRMGQEFSATSFLVDVANDFKITKGGKTWVLTGDYFINQTDGDTLATLTEVRALIEESKAYLPFQWEYVYSTIITDSRPGIGKFRLNNATYSLVTQIYIDNFDNNSTDKSNFISLVDTGAVITIRDGANYINYRLTGGVVAGGSYYKLGVAYQNNFGVVSDLCDFNIELNNNVGGSGGGGTTDSLFHEDTEIWLVNGDTIPKADSVRDSFTSDTFFINNTDGQFISNNGSSHILISNLSDDGVVNFGVNNRTRIANGNIQGFVGTENVYMTLNPSNTNAALPSYRFRGYSTSNQILGVIDQSNNSVFLVHPDSTTIKPNGGTSYNFTETTLEASDKAAEFNSISIGGGDVLTTSDTIDLKIAVESNSFDNLTFNKTNQTNTVGELSFDSINENLKFKNDVFEMPLSRTIPVRYFNNTGETINKGDLLRSGGAKVNGGITFIADFAGNGSLDSLIGVAMAAHTTLDQNYGEAVVLGAVYGLNTSAFSNGDIGYVGSNRTLIDTSPTPPNYEAIAGRVIYADDDSGAFYMLPFAETKFNPEPQFSAYFNDSSIVINNTAINTYFPITNATNNLFIEDVNFGFEFKGDSIRPLQGGIYKIDFTYSFRGNASQIDEWNVGVFKNGVLEYKQIRSTSSNSAGGVPFFWTLTLTNSDWISFKVENTSDGTRDCTFIDAGINVQYLTTAQ